MIIFKTFFKIMKKHFSALFIYFIIFATLTIALSNSSMENETASFSDEKINVTVINEDSGSLGNALETYLKTTQNLVSIENNKTKLQDALYYRDTEYILTIPSYFTEKFSQGEQKDSLLKSMKVPNSYNSYFVEEQLNQYLNILSFYIKDHNIDDSISLTNEAVSLKCNVMLKQKEENSSQDAIYYFYQYLSYIFTCILVIGIGPILASFQKKNIKERILCSSFRYKNLQLTLGCLVFSLGTIFLFTLLGIFTYGIPTFFSIRGIHCLINSFFALLFALSIAFCAGMFAHNPNILSMISNTVGLGLSFLCGVFVPLEYMDPKVIQISKFLPTYWYVRANQLLAEIAETSFITTEQLKELYKYYGIQFLFSLAVFAITLSVLKARQKEH